MSNRGTKQMQSEKAMIDKQRVLAGLDIREYFIQFFPQAKDGRPEISVNSPFRKDHNPSFSVNLETGLWHDHATGEGGDPIAFEMRLSKCDFTQALQNLARFCGIAEQASATEKNTVSGIADHGQYVEALYSPAGRAAVEFLNEKRGLTDETLRLFQVGYDVQSREIVIPVFDRDGKSIVQRRYFRYDFVTGSKKIRTEGKATLFGTQFIRKCPDGEHIVIAEGEWDAMVLTQHGFCSVTGTAGAMTWYDAWSELLSGRKVVVCYDSDTAGRKGSKKVSDSVLGTCDEVRVLDIFGSAGTKDMKDVSDFFVKQHHSADDFRKLISSAQVVPNVISGLPADVYEELKSNKNLTNIHPAQDYSDGIFYYGIKLKDDRFLITSTKKCIPFSKCTAEGISLAKATFDVSGFPASGVIRFFESNEPVNVFRTFDDIRQYIRRYVHFSDDQVYSFLSLWVMGTYAFRAFRYFPYLHLNGEKGSGKTLLMEILRPIVFNGQMMVSSTEAVIFRDIQNNFPTLFLDEIERLRKDDRERHGAIMDVLKAGFSRTGTVKRCGGQNKDTVMTFSCYSPKILAGISDLDDVLRDRTITLHTVRRLASEKVDPYRENQATLLLHEEIRTNLYLFGLQIGPDIARMYNESAEELPGLDHLNNRELDIWMPIILLASVVDVSRGDEMALVKDSMVGFSQKKIQERRQDDAQENDTLKLLSVLSRILSENVPHARDGKVRLYDTSDVYDFFKGDDDFSWLESKAWLTRRIKKLGVKVKTVRRGPTTAKTYAIDPNIVNDLKVRFQLPEVESETVTVTPSDLQPIHE